MNEIDCWIEERCYLRAEAETTVSALFADWREWSQRNEVYTGSVRPFAMSLIARNFPRHRGGKGKRHFFGLMLKPVTVQLEADGNE